MVHCDTQEEIDYYWEKLSAVPEAEQCGWLKDKYGVSWQIVPTAMDEMMKDKDEKKIALVTKVFLKMKKFDIAKLEEAYEGKVSVGQAKQKQRRLIVPVILLLFVGSTYAASPSQNNSAVEEDVILQEIETAEGKEGILAKIIIPAPIESVWDVMTDYEKLSDFIPDMKLSKVIEKKDNIIILRQQGESHFLMFHFDIEVIIKLAEQRYHDIKFNLVSGDFDYFEGEWKTESLGDNGTMLTYTLIAHPKFYAPKWVVRYMLKRDIPLRLKALRERVLKINSLH